MSKKPKKGKKASKASINQKLNRILKRQAFLLRGENRIEKEEIAEEKEEKRLERTEKEELAELKNLEEIEKEVKKELKVHPLRRITRKDIAKGAVGAFAGLLVHYTFTYGIKTAAELDMFRATMLFPLSFFIGVLFLYVTGFRKVKDPSLMKFLPLRVTVLYVISVIISLVVLVMLYPPFGASLAESYKQLAALTLPAIIGACTADLIGRD